MISHLIVSLIVALIAIAFDSTYVDQDNLPVVTSGTSWYSGSSLCAESSWDRVALTPYTTAMGQRCVRSSGPIRYSPSPDAFPQVVQRLRHEPYRGTRLPRGSRPLQSLARIRPSGHRVNSYSSEGESTDPSIGISSHRATSPPGPLYSY